MKTSWRAGDGAVFCPRLTSWTRPRPPLTEYSSWDKGKVALHLSSEQRRRRQRGLVSYPAKASLADVGASSITSSNLNLLICTKPTCSMVPLPTRKKWANDRFFKLSALTCLPKPIFRVLELHGHRVVSSRLR